MLILIDPCAYSTGNPIARKWFKIAHYVDTVTQGIPAFAEMTKINRCGNDYKKKRGGDDEGDAETDEGDTEITKEIQELTEETRG